MEITGRETRTAGWVDHGLPAVLPPTLPSPVGSVTSGELHPFGPLQKHRRRRKASRCLLATDSWHLFLLRRDTALSKVTLGVWCVLHLSTSDVYTRDLRCQHQSLWGMTASSLAVPLFSAAQSVSPWSCAAPSRRSSARGRPERGVNLTRSSSSPPAAWSVGSGSPAGTETVQFGTEVTRFFLANCAWTEDLELNWTGTMKY